MLSKLVKGSCVADPRFLKIIIQRLGKSPNKMEYIVSKDFLDSVKEQNEFDECIDCRDREKSKKLLEKIETNNSFTDYKNIKKMYNCRNNAAFEYYINNNIEMALSLIKEAINITLPGFSIRSFSEYAYSSIELENLLFMASIWLCKSGKQYIGQGERLIGAIEKYVYEFISDKEELAALMPKVKLVKANILIKKGDFDDATHECVEGIDYIRECGMLHMSLPLLNVIVNYGKMSMPAEECELYVRFRDLIQWLQNECMFPKGNFDSLFFDVDRAIYHYEAEVYKGQRQIRSLTQEKTAELADISFDAISRYEKGKRSPGKAKYPKLMEALNLDYAKQGTYLICEDFSLLEDERTFNSSLLRGDYDNATSVIDEITSKIDMSNRRNQALISIYRNQIGLRKKTLTPESVIKMDIVLLEEMYPFMTEHIERMPFLVECGIIAQIYICYQMMGLEKEAKEICEKIVGVFKYTYVDLRMVQRTFGLHLTNLSQMECDAELVEYALKYRLKCRNFSGLDRILAGYALQYYDINKAFSKDVMTNALYSAIFLKNGNVERLQRYLKDYYCN
jgi:transcriptional regulator with XRE-family HTH domain